MSWTDEERKRIERIEERLADAGYPVTAKGKKIRPVPTEPVPPPVDNPDL